MPPTETSLGFLELIKIFERKDDGRSFKCTQITKCDSGHCGNLVKRDDANNALRKLCSHLDKHAEGKLPKDSALAVVSASLSEAFLCSFRHKKDNLKERAREQWEDELSDDEKRTQLHDKLKLKLSTLIISAPPLQSSPSSPMPPTRSGSREVTPSKFKLYDDSPRESPTRETKRDIARDTAQEVTNLLLKKLGPSDEKSAFIYLFSHPQEKEMFKIGLTTNPEQRFQTHEKCYNGYTRVEREYIRFARRFEQVILAEFRQQRYKLVEKCPEPNCKTAHTEWIRAPNKKSLVTSFKKWVDFANADRSPYNSDGSLDHHVVLPSPAWPVNKPDSSSKKKSVRVDVRSSPESTPSKTKSSRPKNRLSQGSTVSVTDADDSEQSFIDEGVSDLSLGSSECGIDSMEKARESTWLRSSLSTCS